MTEEKVRFAVIGCGHIGKRHCEKIHDNNQAELIAVCDIDEKRAEELGKKYDVPFYTTHEELLAKEKNVDMVNVCVPNGLHAKISTNIARAEKNILCEKPMAITTEDAQDMIAVAETNNVKLLIVKQNRYNPPVVAVKEAIDAGKLGNISSVVVNGFWNRNPDYFAQADWRGTKELDGGALFTQFSHFIDLMLYLVGGVHKVFAYADNKEHPQIAIDDVGSILLQFKNGAIGTFNYTNNVYEKNYEGSITIIGSNGTIKIGGQYLNELEFWNVDGEKEKTIEKIDMPNNYGFYKGSMSNHAQVIENAVEVIQRNGAIHTTGMEGYKTVEIIEAIYLSAKERREVKLP